jgi:hypothetical protein
MPDPVDIIKGLPLKKTATPQQLLVLAVACAVVFFCGFRASNAVQEINQGISRVDSKVDSLNSRMDWMQKTSWTRQDHIEWVQEFDRANRQTVPALIVPQVLFTPASPLIRN